MDNSLLKQYEDYFDLFSREGWKLLMEDIDSMIESVDSLDYVNTIEELHNTRGQLSILKRIRGFEQSIQQAYEQLVEEDAEQANLLLY